MVDACTPKIIMQRILNKLYTSLGEPPKLIFGKSWDFVPTSLTPNPLRNVGIHEKENKKCLFCILGYSKHIIFS